VKRAFNNVKLTAMVTTPTRARVIGPA